MASDPLREHAERLARVETRLEQLVETAAPLARLAVVQGRRILHDRFAVHSNRRDQRPRGLEIKDGFPGPFALVLPLHYCAIAVSGH